MYLKILAVITFYVNKINLTLRMSIFCSVLFVFFVGGYTSSYRNRTNDYLDKYNDPTFFVQEVYVKTFALGYTLEKTSEKNPYYDKLAIFDNDYNTATKTLLKRKERLANYKDIGKYNIYSIIDGEKIVFYKDAFVIQGTYTTKISDRITNLVSLYFQNIKLFFKNIKKETLSSQSIQRLNYVLCSDFLISYVSLVVLTFSFNKYFVYKEKFHTRTNCKIGYMPISHLSIVACISLIIFMKLLKSVGIMSPNVTNNLLLESIFKLKPPFDTIYLEVFIYWCIVKSPFVTILADFYFITKNKPRKKIPIYFFIILFSNFLIYFLIFTTFFLRLVVLTLIVFILFMYYLFSDNIKKIITDRTATI